MLKTIRKIKYVQYIFTVFALVLIVDQSLAGFTGCNKNVSNPNGHTVQSMDLNDPHANHHMDPTINMAGHLSMTDCCLNDCQCTQNTCSSSLSMIATSTGLEFFQGTYSSVYNSSAAYISQVPSALFRPPIIC